MRFLLLFLAILSLLSCDSSTNLNSRAKYWKNELENLIPLGTSEGQALIELQKIDPDAFVNLLSGDISSKLETIESNGLPCKNWVISGTTTVTNGVVSGHSIANVGRCL